MEHSDELTSGGYRFFYDDRLFAPSTDTFLLSSLPRLKRHAAVCDLGAGTGLLGLLLLAREPTLTITGLELQPAAAALAQKTAAVNGFTQQLQVITADLRQPEVVLPTGSCDLVVCNPPYYPQSSGYVSPSSAKSTARTELTCTLDDVCRTAAYLLRWGGSFCLVHKPERLTDVLCTLRNHRIEPKRLRFVCPRSGAAPSLLLVEGRRGGKPGLAIEQSLVLYRSDGTPTAELDTIYFRNHTGAST